jgi:uncharacterized alkaline shock family protein YloU
MEGHSVISPEVLAQYAADAARETRGVHRVVDGPLKHRPAAKVLGSDVEVHLAIEWGAVVPDVAADVQARVRAYLEQMAGVSVPAVHVVVDDLVRP